MLRSSKNSSRTMRREAVTTRSASKRKNGLPPHHEVTLLPPYLGLRCCSVASAKRDAVICWQETQPKLLGGAGTSKKKKANKANLNKANNAKADGTCPICTSRP